MVPFVDFGAIAGYVASEPIGASLNFFGFVAWTSLLPCVLYTAAVRHADAGKVATLASGAEPVSSMLVGIWMYHEIPSVLGFAGMFLTITALILLIKVEEKQDEK